MPRTPRPDPSPDGTVVRPAARDDAGQMAAIYNHYITETVVTFEEAVVSAVEMARRMAEVRSASLPWLVALRNGALAGYAYANKWRERPGYRFAAEVTVYVSPDRIGQGIGSILYARLLAELRDAGIRTAIGGIALPNDGSVALHEKFGFKKVAHFVAPGVKFNRWLDVGYWQRML